MQAARLYRVKHCNCFIHEHSLTQCDAHCPYQQPHALNTRVSATVHLAHHLEDLWRCRKQGLACKVALKASFASAQ